MSCIIRTLYSKSLLMYQWANFYSTLLLSIHFKLVWIHRHTNPIELFIHLTSNKVVKSSRSRMSSIVFLKIKMFWVLFVKSVLWRYFSYFKAKTLISVDWPLDWSLMVIKMFALKSCWERLRDEKRFDSDFSLQQVLGKQTIDGISFWKHCRTFWTPSILL